MPGVTITLAQNETGLMRVAVTDELGRYRAPLLPVGPYTIKAELADFATPTREGVNVTVGLAPVIDLTLPLATVTEALTVNRGHSDSGDLQRLREHDRQPDSYRHPSA